MEHAPTRYGDWSAVNRHLTAGGSLEHVPWGNPHLEYIKKCILKKEVRDMAQKRLFEVCHGCGREVYLNELHFKAKLVDGTVYFHKGCYLYYIEQRGDILTNVLKYEPRK